MLLILYFHYQVYSIINFFFFSSEGLEDDIMDEKGVIKRFQLTSILMQCPIYLYISILFFQKISEFEREEAPRPI